MDSTATGPEITVAVDLGPRSYDVRVVTAQPESLGPFVRASLNRTWAGRSCRSALIVTDSNVAELSLPAQCQAALSQLGIESALAIVPAGESSKSLARASQLYDELVTLKADRHSLIVALGGGVIGDLTGFVAATFSRGLSLIMVPTTLLAQVDSSVGGKVGVNYPGAKNLIGAFHQPTGVWIDTDSLLTLPTRELHCGLAEVVKYGVILDGAFFAELERDPARILDRQSEALRWIVAQSCRLKAEVVARDEREETGLRAVLNFGHTIGHAIEAVAGYDGPFQHGEAVAVGMAAESRLAQRIGWIGPEISDRLVRLLVRFGLPTKATGLDPDRLFAAMSLDKKNQRGRLRFVLPRSIGKVELTDAPSETDIRAVLEAL